MTYAITSLDADCYPNSTVLVNKLGLKTQTALDEAERIAVTLRATEVELNPPTEPFSFAYYCELHRILFGDLYDWAGSLRTVDISKKGTDFYPAGELNSLGNALFLRLQNSSEFRGLSHRKFVERLTEFYHSLNMLHPFREGNGRTQRLFVTLLVRRAGYDIDFSECDTDRLMMATIYAAQGIMDFLRECFDEFIIEKE